MYAGSGGALVPEGGGRHGRAAADLFGFPDTAAGQTSDTRLQWVLIPTERPPAAPA